MCTMVIDESTLATIVTRLTEAASPARIILFDSAATGPSTSDSHIDPLVVEDEVDDVRAESVRLRTALGDLGHPVGVLVIRTERFEKTKDLVGGITYPASRYGIVLYEAA
jgi:predicted nucleotidyltransferase